MGCDGETLVSGLDDLDAAMPGLWSEMGDQIDPHLQKADLKPG